jgi:glycosyltransferase involved in cell wall biosynthesis
MRGRGTIVVLGMITKMPVSGIVWLTIPYLLGLRRLGFDVHYVEAHARTPSMLMSGPDDDGAERAAGYLDSVMRRFDLGGQWAYHALHADGAVYGSSARKLRELYRSAALIINLHGGTEPLSAHLENERLVMIETDPVAFEIELQRGDERAWSFLDAHAAVFTWGTNLGRPSCLVPMPSGVEFHPTRMPILLDQWQLQGIRPRQVFTTIGNWRQAWRDIEFEGELYTWSKHHEFLKFIDLPRRTTSAFELALASYDDQAQNLLEEHGWRIRPADEISSDLDAYRRYIAASRGEFTVAKDQNVRLRSGWFSDRSAAYLAAGRPVITQETGFSESLPTGEGLFAFSTLDEILAALEVLESDYGRHSRAALEIGREYFDAHVVLADMLEKLDLAPGRRSIHRSRIEPTITKPPRRSRGACTIISRNYLAYARVLAESFAKHNPGIPFYVLLADRNDGTVNDEHVPFELVELADVGVPDLDRFCFQYSVVELNTAVKPYFLSHLLVEKGLEQLIYLDPDILVVGELDEVWELLEGHEIVLTPHLTAPVDDGRKPSEVDILLSGTYNLGFLGLARSETSERLLAWWQDRLYDRCLVAHDEGLFTDQRWIDLVPGFFDRVHVLRDPGYNIAYWNFHSRTVEVRPRGILVNGSAARFFHFSGFDLHDPHTISRHQNRFRLDELGDLAQVFDRYRKLLLAAGHEACRRASYAFGTFDNGVAVPEIARSIYRRLGVESRRFGDPFAVRPVSSFFGWLNSPHPDDGRAERPITRLWYEVYAARPDVRQAYPDPFGDDRERFLHWTEASGLREHGIDGAFLSASPVKPKSEPGANRPFGVNVAGYSRSEKGMGEAVRADLRILQAAGVPYVLNDVVDAGALNGEMLDEPPRDANPYAFNLVHVNADQVPLFADRRGSGYFEGRYNIGYWTWELSEFPDEWRTSFDWFDEVWVPSTFALDAISRAAPVPVIRVPHALDAEEPSSLAQRSDFGLPDAAFLFLFMFDFHSFVERKNPFGLIEAFRRAFRPSEPVGLVLKCSHSGYDTAGLDDLRAAAAGANVHFVDAVLARPKVRALMAATDAYVSLHRSEGFGLTIAEAMTLGKPVIATGYSGNLDFMHEANSFLVDYELVRIDRDHGPYKRGYLWAEPDLEHAAGLLRRVVDEPAHALERATRGRRDVLRELDPRRLGAVMTARLGEIESRASSKALRGAQRHSDSEQSYDALLLRMRDVIARVVPPGSEPAVVSKGDDRLLLLGDRRCSHFPRTPSGAYEGHHPANDEDAITALEDARSGGASHLVFPATSRWWLDHYTGLREHLERRYTLLLDDPKTCVIYSLESRPVGEGPSTAEEAVEREAAPPARAYVASDAVPLARVEQPPAAASPELAVVREVWRTPADTVVAQAARVVNPVTDVGELEVADVARPDRIAAEPGAAHVAPGSDYRAAVQRIRELVAASVPKTAPITVVSKGDAALLELNGNQAWHFPSGPGGEYAGYHPRDDRTAIEELEATRERGARYLLIPKPAFWWLGYYLEFARHLERYRLVARSGDCLLYDLSPLETTAAVNGRSRGRRLRRRLLPGRASS